MSYDKGFISIAEESYFVIIEEAPESLQKEMKEKTDLLLYDMYANHLADKGRTYSQINKAFKVSYSDKFMDFVRSVLVKHEDRIREFHNMRLNHVDFSKIETTLNANSPFYGDGPSGYVTLQQRFEFEFPTASYEALFNFLYFGRVPYTRGQEKKTMPNPNGNTLTTGIDYFLAGGVQRVNPMSTIPSWLPGYGLKKFEIPTSSQYEGAICIFPPYLYRATTPFYSTKEYKVVYKGELDFRKPKSFI
jgi:hypothetical protein